MKKYIREMIDDLQGRKKKDYIPPVPQPAADAKTVSLDAPPAPVLPEDLSNQVLSDDPLQRVRQMDFQARQQEEGQ